MMKKSVVFAILLFCAYCLSAKNNFLIADAKLLSMGQAVTAIRYPASVFYNPSVIIKKKHVVAGVGYHNRFMVPELAERSAFIVRSMNNQGVGLSLLTFGPAEWLQSEFAFSYARKIGRYFDLGVTLRGYADKYPELDGFVGHIAPAIGVLVHSFSHTNIGAVIKDFVSQPFVDHDINTNLNWSLRAGAATSFRQNLLLSYEISYIETMNWAFHAGFSWLLVDNFCIRGGINTRSKTMTVGVGWFYRNIETSVAFSHHMYLGYFPAISVQIPFSGFRSKIE